MNTKGSRCDAVAMQAKLAIETEKPVRGRFSAAEGGLLKIRRKSQ